MVEMGVNAFNIPVNELSIFVSAIQNRKAGKKLPNNPDKMISGIFFAGMPLICLSAKGINSIPALNNRSAATWYALNLYIPTFINIKELPQINDKAKNIIHFITRLCCSIKFQSWVFEFR